MVLKYTIADFAINIRSHLDSHFWLMAGKELIERLTKEGLLSKLATTPANTVLDASHSSANLISFCLQYDLVRAEVARRIYLDSKTSVSQLEFIYKTNMVFANWDHKVYQLLPVYTWQAKYIMVDTLGLHSILRAASLTSLNFEQFQRVRTSQWRQHFLCLIVFSRIP